MKISCFFFISLEESKQIKEIMDKGNLLPDELVLKFIVGELRKLRDKGFLLDGKIDFSDLIRNILMEDFHFFEFRFSTNIQSSKIIG